MSSAAEDIFKKSLAMVNKAIAAVHPGISVQEVLAAGEFEQAVYMIWVASRLYFFDAYLPKRQEELMVKLLQLNPLFAEKKEGTFTRDEVIALVKLLAGPISRHLSGLRQGQTSTRGSLFEHIVKHPVAALFNGRTRSDGSKVVVARTPKKRQMENVDIAISVGDIHVVGLSVKGNVRERLRESIQRAANAMNRGYFSHVWHCVLTSGDAADRESLNTALSDSLYHGHRIYTWAPLCTGTSAGFPRGAQLIPLSRLPGDITAAVGL